MWKRINVSSTTVTGIETTMGNTLNTKGAQAGTTVSTAIETFPKHLFVLQIIFISQYRHFYMSIEVQKPSSFEQYNIPETFSTKSYLKKQRKLSALPIYCWLPSTHIACYEIFKKLAATSFGKCQCLKIGNCANKES